MVRFLALAGAAVALAATPLAAAQARTHKAEPPARHGKKASESKDREPKGRAHGRARNEEDDAPRGRHPTHRWAREDREEDYAPLRHGHARVEHAATRESDDCAPARPARRGRHARPAPRSCHPVEMARNETRAPYVPPAPPAAPKSIDDILAAVDGPPPGPPKPIVITPPSMPLVLDSPVGRVKHANPAPGIIVVSNPDLWAERRQAEHRSHEAALRLTLAALMNHSDAELRTTLGMPDLQRTEGDGALWTYRLPNCSLMVFLHRTAGTTYKVTGAQSGPLSSGGASPDVDACLRSINSGSR